MGTSIIQFSALTLTLSPGEREQQSEQFDLPFNGLAITDFQPGEGRRMILPLLGERAGVRADAPLTSNVVSSVVGPSCCSAWLRGSAALPKHGSLRA